MELRDLDRSWAPAVLDILNDAILTSTALWDYDPRPPDAMDAWFSAKEAGHRDHRGRGLGLELVAAIIDCARRQGYHNVIAGIEASNAASRALPLRLGFEHCGAVRHAGFKFGRWLDLELHQRLLDTPPDSRDG